MNQPTTPEQAPDRTIRVLVLPTHEDPFLAEVVPVWETYRALLGGYIQSVPLRVVPGALLWCNEDGKSLGLPVNIFASAVAHLVPSSLRTGDMLVGPVVVVGSVDPVTGEQDDREHDVPAALVDLLRAHGIPVHDDREGQA